MTDKRRKVAPFIEYVSESATACLVTMVQGNMLALTASHLLIASQTGVIAGVFTALLVLFAKTDKRWVIAVIIGTATAIVDFFVHHGNFGPVAFEAIVTGVGAAILSFLVATLVKSLRKRAAD